MARKLLLADDSITIQKVVELVLAEEGFEIKAVNNGDEALAVVSAFKPDIVLADIEMPKVNGYQLCEKLKLDPATRNIPVILLSGAFEPLDEELAKQVKADSFVIKPFESQELISKINAALISPAVEEAEEEAVAVEAGTEEETVAAEAAVSEEDLWAMEEVPAEAAEEEIPAEAEIEEMALPETVETAETEEINIAEEFEAVEAAEVEAEEAVEHEIGAPALEARAEKPAPAQAIKMPEISLPSKEELSSIFKKALDERIASLLSGIDIKSEMLSSITPSLKDTVEKVLWEIAPELTERVVREMLQASLASLNKEVEKVIWEAVPDVAERMIAKEIEKIRSEM